MLAALAFVIWLPLFIGILGWPRTGDGGSLRAERYAIPLAPLSQGALASSTTAGWLDHPINFGYRCTLVDAAAVLDYYGARVPQVTLALQLSRSIDYSNAGHGPPWTAYLAWPGQSSLLDAAIERVAGKAGLHVTAQTVIGINFARAAAAIAHNHPIILNMARTPDGTYNHSLLAYGYDTRHGRALLLVLDPNTQQSYWVGPNTYWSTTITSTFIVPADASLWA
jgi:hypothetical protein